ncbi:MAG TPA: type I 3-dehydroquinate dehydratase [Candidatus Polarisedimenticolaceae bacterium]|nr:type I 3-dehydroquinate dehydratase [Candidatus Polarisedimenticolaceae bacterium]
MQGEVVLSVAEADAASTARRLADVPAGCARVEIRADRLRASDLPGLIARSPRPVLVTARRVEDGGAFDRPEIERGALLEAALAAGAWIDVEWGSALGWMAEGDMADRVVLSRHEVPCRLDAMLPVYREMARSRAARLKLVPRADRPSEGAAVREVLARARADGRALACFALGDAGTATRVLALSWGSWATYGSVETGAETADGQLPARVLLDVFGAPALGKDAALFGLVGTPIARSPSPRMHQAGYRALGLAACYLPFPAEDPGEVQALVGAYGLAGFGVTIPLKEAVASRCRLTERLAARAGAVNTVVVHGDGWEGFNTDGPAARALLEAHLDLRGAKVLVLGAGGTAAGIGAALQDAGARVALCGRSPARAEALARRLGAETISWEARAQASWDALVQATPLGVFPEEALRGRAVLDAAYGAAPTPLAAAARARGLGVVEGRELLAAQAALQFRHLTGREIAVDVLHRAAGRP